MTAYIAAQAATRLAAGSTLTLRPEYGSRTIRFTPLGRQPTAALLIPLAQRIAYELGLWHEIATWYDSTQQFSSFSPEDCYSNLLGTCVAASALSGSLAFNTAMDMWTLSTLQMLGAVSTAETKMVLTALSSRWWEDRHPLPPNVKRRNMDAIDVVRPWLVDSVPDPQVQAAVASLSCTAGRPQAGTPQAQPLMVPSSAPDRTPLESYYTLEINPSGGVAAEVQSKTVTPFDFPALIQRIRNELPANYPDGDMP